MFEGTHNPDRGITPNDASGRHGESSSGLARLEGLIKMATGVDARVVELGTVRRSSSQLGIEIIELPRDSSTGAIRDSRGLDPDFPDLLARYPLTDGTSAVFLPLSGSVSAQPEGTNVDTRSK